MTFQQSSEAVVCQLSNSLENNLCQICGNKARCVNYGALTCLSCRAFFRRHVFSSKNIRSCPNDGACELRIHSQKRRACIACRLAKCLAVGMNTNYFRKFVKQSEKYSSTNESNEKKSALISTLNLLDRNRSNCLTSSQWTLLSNVVHAYDNFNGISDLSYIMKTLPEISMHSILNISLMKNIFIEMTSSMIAFYRSIPDFQILTSSEHRSLLNRNLPGTSCFIFRLMSCIHNSLFLNNYTAIYGLEALSRMRSLTDRFDSDYTIVKLMLLVLTFSPNLSILISPDNIPTGALLLGTFRLFSSQNVYVELLWKYMLYRYGFSQTVIRFSNMIKQVLNCLEHLMKSCMQVKSIHFSFDEIFSDKSTYSYLGK